MVRGFPGGAPGSASPVMDLLLSNQCKKKDLKRSEKLNIKCYTLNLNCTFFNWQNILSELYDVLCLY